MECNQNKKLRFALIGCGAVSEWQHLPALLKCQNVIVSALVDNDQRRLELLSRACPSDCIKTNIVSDLVGKIDCAIVALPHYLHAEISKYLLIHGIHVLVEKPMAISVSECDEMISASNAGKAFLGVGLLRRFFPSVISTKSIVESGILGRIRHFDFQEGSSYDWPTVSPSFFNKISAGGGVLIDSGAHVIDQLLWCFGDADHFAYYDDAAGGVEAECKIEVTLLSGTSGTIQLSRLRKLRNTFCIQGEAATLEIDVAPLAYFKIYDPQNKVLLDAIQDAPPNYINGYDKATSDQLKAFIKACHGCTTEIVTGQEARRSMEFIEHCYSIREYLPYAWEDK